MTGSRNGQLYQVDFTLLRSIELIRTARLRKSTSFHHRIASMAQTARPPKPCIDEISNRWLYAYGYLRDLHISKAQAEDHSSSGPTYINTI